MSSIKVSKTSDLFEKDSVMDIPGALNYSSKPQENAVPAINRGPFDLQPQAQGGKVSQPKFFAYDNPVMKLESDIYSENGEREKVEFIVREKSFFNRIRSLYFVDLKSAMSIVVLRLLVKIVTCVMYIVRVLLDNPKFCDDFDSRVVVPTTPTSLTEQKVINWFYIGWICHPTPIWMVQLVASSISLFITSAAVILQSKGNLFKLLTFDFILELIISIPVLLTLLPALRGLFVPIFLNCWLARSVLKDLFSQRSIGAQSNFTRQLVDVMATIFCLVFTGICSIEHLQRGSPDVHYNLFQSLYFIMVTLSTVGYGDFYPDIWPSQLCMITMICVALIVLPKQFESLAFTWMEMQRLGGSYPRKGRGRDRHVVVCSTELTEDLIYDFMNEFFSHRHLQDSHVVFIASADLDSEVRHILKMPLYAHKSTFIKGSCLKDEDLTRTRVNDAAACFLLGADNSVDKAAADQHTILRSWAIKDFAPNVPQYVQIFRPQSIVHVKFAEHVVCEDEFKYAMLAYNCMIPGTSTLITLLLHTSRGQEGQNCEEPWLKLYGKCSGNEIYHIVLGESKLFGQFEGQTFSYAAIQAHRMFGTTLIGIETIDMKNRKRIMLNPGQNYHLKNRDVCFYLSITREEDITFVKDKAKHCQQFDKVSKDSDHKSQVMYVANVPEERASKLRILTASAFGKKYNSEETIKSMKSFNKDETLVVGCPPVTPYVGTSPNICFLVKEKKHICCLKLTDMELINNHDKISSILVDNLLDIGSGDGVRRITQDLESHKKKKNKPLPVFLLFAVKFLFLLGTSCAHGIQNSAKDYNWNNRSIIVVADHASLGIYNFIVPLRAYFHNKHTLNPIVLLLEKEPSQSFLDSIAWFPQVYYMLGSIEDLDDLLKAGILYADNVVVVNKEASNAAEEEEDMADCNTIVGVQTMFKYFPNVKITTELSQSSNMRFMHFQANNSYALYLSEVEKKEKERGSIISFMFRLQFASGIVFSASMVDTLLYQAFVKDYLIPIVRLLLGIDQTPGSGFLTSVQVDKKESWMATYGTLFTHLCSFNGDVPIAIFRTQWSPTPDNKQQQQQSQSSVYNRGSEHKQILNLVRSRMVNLKLPSIQYDGSQQQTNRVSYVIINPNCDLELEEGDVLFLLRPPHKK